MKDKNQNETAPDSTSKEFDAVEFMRKRREEISKETENMTPEEELNFVREKFVEYERKKRS
jgi:hypothetical protein